MQTSILQSFIRSLFTVVLFVQAALTTAWGGTTTYFVSPTGSDSNAGTEAAPFQTIQWAASRVHPGDTVIVRDGVYSTNPYFQPSSQWALVVIKWGGSATGWITFKSENKGGAVLDGNNIFKYGFHLEVPDPGNLPPSYIRIQDFEIRNIYGTGQPDDMEGATGIDVNYPGTGYEITGNHIHHIGRKCSDVDNGFCGVYLGNVSSVVVQRNEIHDIGRFSTGENGCSNGNDNYQNRDHGVYVNNVSNLKVKNNIFYDNKHGWGIHFYSCSGPRSSGILVANNTFAFPNTFREGQIILSSPGVVDATIRNNIFYSPKTAAVRISTDCQTTATFSNVNINHNVVHQGAIVWFPDPANPPAGVTWSDSNFENTDPLLVNPGTPDNHDFHLQFASPARDAGFADTEVTDDYDGLTRPQGSAYDIGAYEGFGGLMAHWKLNEASGVRVDAHSVNHLSDNNGVGQADGRLSNAASFIGANEQTLSIADNAALSMGNIGFTIAGWVRFDRLGLHGALSKWDSVALQSEYQLEFFVDDVFGSTARFMVSPDGTSVGFVDNYTLLSANNWVFFVAWYDATASTLNLSVNNLPAASVSYSGGAHDGPTPFYLGRTETDYLDGRLDSVSIWKRVLTSAERSGLYNNYQGLDYPF